MVREPLYITPPPWGDDTVSYARYAKPVLDRYCGQCHQGDGEGRKVLDLTDRPGFLGFSEPYVILTGHPSWGEPYDQSKKPSPGWGLAGMLMIEAYDKTDPAGYKTPAPMTAPLLQEPAHRLRLQWQASRCARGFDQPAAIDRLGGRHVSLPRRRRSAPDSGPASSRGSIGWLCGRGSRPLRASLVPVPWIEARAKALILRNVFPEGATAVAAVV